MEPQSGRTLTPNARDGISQLIHLNGVERGKSSGVKMRWKTSYKVGSHTTEEQGEVPALGVS
jgi:ADP-ribosylation factor-binding protein GGA